MVFSDILVSLISHSTIVSAGVNIEAGENIIHSDGFSPLLFINRIVWAKCSSETYGIFGTYGGNFAGPSNTCEFGEEL